MSSPLAGKLFDEAGKGLTPSYAVKGNRRYRYYVSRALLKGTASQSELGWRIPAAEIERGIAAATRTILEDRRALLADIEQSSSSHAIKVIFESAAAWGHRLHSEAETVQALQILINRVELRNDGIRLSNLPIAPSESLNGHGSTHLALIRDVPIQMRRRGIEMKLVLDGNPKLSPRTDRALLKIIARAHCWFDDLMSGRALSMVEIAKREKVGKRYVSRIIRFAFLAPDIVDQIAAGCQPPELTAESLLRRYDQLPLAWEEQHKMFGFSPPN